MSPRTPTRTAQRISAIRLPVCLLGCLALLVFAGAFPAAAKGQDKVEKTKQALTDTGLIVQSMGEVNGGNSTMVVGRSSSNELGQPAASRTGTVNIYKTQQLALAAYDESLKTNVGNRGAPEAELLNVSGHPGFLRYLVMDAGVGQAVRVDVLGSYRCGEVGVGAVYSDALTPKTAAEKDKFIADARAAGKAWLLNLDQALIRAQVCTGESAEIVLDRKEGTRFSAIKLGGLGFKPTTSDADATHVNIIWEGKELYRIDRTMKDGTLRRPVGKDKAGGTNYSDLWIWVPDDAPFGVNKVWAEEGESGRKSNVIEFTVNKLGPKELNDNFDAVTKMFLETVPANDRWYGWFRSGNLRNIHNAGRTVVAGLLWIPTAIFTLGNYQDELWPDSKFVCSWYQAETLGFFQKLRFDADPKRRALMDGIDYAPFVSGPTDIEFISHFYVAAWPHTPALDPQFGGQLASDPLTAWQSTGIAFDPWPEQRPQIFELKSGTSQWAQSSVYAQRLKDNSHFYILPRPVPDKFTGGPLQSKPLFKGDYPVTGGRYYNIDAPTATDLVKVLGDVSVVGEPPKMVAVKSPVRVQIKDAQGREAGMAEDGSTVNNIPSCEMALVKEKDGHEVWFIDLPEGELEMKLTGLADGSFTVETRRRGQETFRYPPVKITKGAVSTIRLTDGGEQPALKTPDGQNVTPAAVPNTKPGEGRGGSLAGGNPPGGGTGSPGGIPGTGGTGTPGSGTDGTGGTGTAVGGTGTAGGTGSAGGTNGAQPAAGGGAGSVAEGGITVGRNLGISRWYTIRRITKFPRGEEVKFIRSTKISSDGSRIAFAASQGLFTIRPDGTGLVRVSDKPCAMMDISANGNKVAWFEGGPDGLFVANADGSGREKMPGGLNVVSLRMTADGSRLFVLVPEKGGIFMLPADGSDVKKIVTTAAVCKLLEIEENGNHWRSLDISDDGSRIAFNLLWDLFTANGGRLGPAAGHQVQAVVPQPHRLPPQPGWATAGPLPPHRAAGHDLLRLGRRQ